MKSAGLVPVAGTDATADKLRTQWHPESETTYVAVEVAMHDNPDDSQRARIERVRSTLLGTKQSRGCVDCGVALVCPCVPIAQVASSVGSSYLIALLVSATLYLGGLVFMVLAMHEVFGDQFHAGYVVLAIGLECVFYAVGPCVSAPVITFVVLLLQLRADYDVEDEFEYFYMRPYYYVWADMLLDCVLVCYAYIQVRRLRRRVGAPARSLCGCCIDTLWIWPALGKASSSVKAYSESAGTHMGPLDTIPAYS